MSQEDSSSASFPFAQQDVSQRSAIKQIFPSSTLPFAPQDGGKKGEADGPSSTVTMVASSANDATSPEIEAASLRSLKEKLSDFPHDGKSSLVHVQRVAPELADDDHMMIFLRGEDFNVQNALKKLLKYWSHRYKLFGPEKYALPMTISGAMKDHLQALRKGYITILPVCDEAGGPILHINKSAIPPQTEEKIVILWYMLHVTMQNPAAQKYGYVALVNGENAMLTDYDPKWNVQAASICDRSFPTQWKAAHICHANAVFPVVSQAVKAILSKRQRLSFVLHNGSRETVLESLSKYCLPKHCVPDYMGGTLRVCVDSFLRDRLIIEGASLDWHEKIMRSPLQSSKDGDAGSNPITGEDSHNSDTNTSEDLQKETIHSSNNTVKTGAEANAGRSALNAVTSHEQSWLERNIFHTVVPKNDFTSLVQKLAPAVARIKYPSAESIISNSRTAALSIPGWRAPDYPVQKSAAPKRNNSDDPAHDSEKPKAKRGKQGRGRTGDPRMNKAVQAKIDYPNLSLVAALRMGGFVFPNYNAQGVSNSDVIDESGVSLYQRRNQLLRRLRALKKSSEAGGG